MAKRLTIKDMEKREFYQMPKWIYEIKGLKSLHREIYMLGMSNWKLSRENGWTNEKGEVYFKLAIGTLTKMLGAKRDTIMKSLNYLVEIGLMESEKKNGTATKYFIIDPDIEKIKLKTSPKKETGTNNGTGTQKETGTSTEKGTGDQSQKGDPNKNNTIRINKNNISMQKSNFKDYCELISKATDTPLMRVQMCITPSDLKNYSIPDLIDAIDKAPFLKGESTKKPTIKHFVTEKQLDKILGGFYEDKIISKNTIPPVPSYYSGLKEVESW